MKHLFFIFGALFLYADAGAHVTLEQPAAAAGSYYKATLRVGHGCAGSPTTALTVFLPEGFQGAKPMPKPGWQQVIAKAKLAQPYESHGKRVIEDVASITWKGGSLADAHYDEFALFGKLPAREGKLYFKVLQECESGKNEWFAIPEAGKSLHDYPQPAAELLLTAPEHAHHH